MAEAIDLAVWGTGHGPARHLLAAGTRMEDGRTGGPLCGADDVLTAFSDRHGPDQGEDVLARLPCRSCQLASQS